FLSPGVTSELPSHLAPTKFFWSRPKPIDAEHREYAYLPLFTHYGRRLGEQTPSSCEYVALDAQETVELRREIEKFLTTPDGAALNRAFDNAIQNDFLGPAASAVKKEKSLHAQVS
ncbi:MAG: hypothetical protein AAGJ87_02490, partial [Pseudomonadota bacterium]